MTQGSTQLAFAPAQLDAVACTVANILHSRSSNPASRQNFIVERAIPSPSQVSPSNNYPPTLSRTQAIGLS